MWPSMLSGLIKMMCNVLTWIWNRWGCYTFFHASMNVQTIWVISGIWRFFRWKHGRAVTQHRVLFVGTCISILQVFTSTLHLFLCRWCKNWPKISPQASCLGTRTSWPASPILLVRSLALEMTMRMMMTTAGETIGMTRRGGGGGGGSVTSPLIGK